MKNSQISKNQKHLREILGKPEKKSMSIFDFIHCFVVSVKVLIKLIYKMTSHVCPRLY